MTFFFQKRQDHNENKICTFEGGWALGREQNRPWERHDNIILNVQILLSRNFVVIAQAPRNLGVFTSPLHIRVPRGWGN